MQLRSQDYLEKSTSTLSGHKISHLYLALHILRLISQELNNVSRRHVELSWSGPVVVYAEVARSQEATTSIHVSSQRSKIPNRMKYLAIKATSPKYL